MAENNFALSSDELKLAAKAVGVKRYSTLKSEQLLSGLEAKNVQPNQIIALVKDELAKTPLEQRKWISLRITAKYLNVPNYRKKEGLLERVLEKQQGSTQEITRRSVIPRSQQLSIEQLHRVPSNRLHTLTTPQLKEIAGSLELSGFKRYNKSQLISLLKGNPIVQSITPKQKLINDLKGKL